MNLPFEVLSVKKDRAGNIIIRIKVLKETIQEVLAALKTQRAISAEEFEKMFPPLPSCLTGGHK